MLKKILNETDITKSVGINTISPIFIKIKSNIIAESLMIAINSSLRQIISPKTQTWLLLCLLIRVDHTNTIS